MLFGPRLAHRDNFKISVTTQNIDAHRLCVALTRQIDRGTSDSEVTDAHVLHFFRKRRVMQIDSRLAGANLQPKTCLQQHEYRARSPCLRRTCDRIQCRSLPRTPPKTTDQLWKPAKNNLRREFEQP